MSRTRSKKPFSRGSGSGWKLGASRHFSKMSLFRAQFLQGPDVEVDQEIALAIAVHGGPLPFRRRIFPLWVPGSTRILALPCKGDLDLGAERRLHEGDIVVEVEVAAVAGEELVVHLADLDQQVSGHAPGGGGVALAAEVELHAVLHAGGDLNLHHGLLAAQAVFVRILRLGLDAPPQAAAGGTGRCRLHLAEDGVGDPADLTGSAALAAGRIPRPSAWTRRNTLTFLVTPSAISSKVSWTLMRRLDPFIRRGPPPPPPKAPPKAPPKMSPNWLKMSSMFMPAPPPAAPPMPA